MVGNTSGVELSLVANVSEVEKILLGKIYGGLLRYETLLIILTVEYSSV